MSKQKALAPQAYYYSMVHNQKASNVSLGLAQTMASNKNQLSINSLHQNSPIGASGNVGVIKNLASGIKKKTLAAYANPRTHANQRNNLIYTQKHHSVQP